MSMTHDDFSALEQKYASAPRKGWSNKGSRTRANQTIEVNRDEVTQALRDAEMKALINKRLATEAVIYQKLLKIIAEGDEAVICEKCKGAYLSAWAEGRCPYCGVDLDEGFSIFEKFQQEKRQEKK